MKRAWEKLPLLLFATACLGLAWSYGVVSTKRQLFPYAQAQSAYAAVQQVAASFEPDHLHPVVHDFTGVRVHDRARISPGTVLITSHFAQNAWRAGVELVDLDGNVLHRWNTDPARLFPGKASGNSYIHGTHLFPNGDLLLNIEYFGMARLDACGNVKWTLDQPATHHSIARSADGNFWVPGTVTVPDDEMGRSYFERFQILSPPAFVDHILKVSPDGKVLRDVDLLDLLYRNGLERQLAKTEKHLLGDILHLNDIEELSPTMAAEYPTLKAGDLVVSVRHLHLVFVVDPATWKVKWHTTEPFIQQHDPDFIGKGWIGVFDNNHDTTARGSLLGGTRIVAVRPDTNQTKQLYPTPKSARFYTAEGGKWQQLSNGNLLIVEAQAGRVFEVSPTDGALVWEWVNQPFDGERVPEVLEGTKYELTRDEIAAWGC
jgi:hypothetical protein